MDESKVELRRFKLTGKRFEGGRLPIDYLVELQNYQALVQTLTVAKWQAGHPGEEVPADLKAETSLAIERIDEGSADIYVVLEQQTAYVQYQGEAQSVVEQTISAAYSGQPLPELPKAINEEIRLGVSQIGATLQPDQTIEIYAAGVDAPPVVVTITTRKEAVDRLALEDFFLTDDPVVAGSHLATVQTSVAGRITELDPEKQSFRFRSLRYGELRGFYKDNPEQKENLKGVLGRVAEP